MAPSRPTLISKREF